MFSKKGVFTYCLILTAGSIYAQHQTDTTWYDSGKIRSIRHIGYFNGCQMSVDTDTLFYESGKIQQTVQYDNRKSRTENGCHATWTTIHSSFFYPNGKLKSVCYYKSCYDCTKCACGTWTGYNEKGKVVSVKKFGDCYDQLPCN
ncbi:toxin-antitoxin system YwqK family antitoxin [Chitinophaga defluvii]|uniref:MORN repeat protein n=1 Tax=Chitinophaga defluvii TaxID=3163343 RepID=A0ABV2TCZ8_9BACT